jgi:hypothetical protein
MHGLLALLFFLALPFWETRPPEKWTDREIETVLHASPWVEVVGPDPAVQVYLATAAPIEEAEAEWRARIKKPLPMLDPDYLDYVREHREDAFVLAISYEKLGPVGRAEENHRMEEDSVMTIGRRDYRILGYFPPTTTDPVLRLIFPRALKPTDKTVEFKLYVPGAPFPEREVSFRVKDLVYHGKLQM